MSELMTDTRSWLSYGRTPFAEANAKTIVLVNEPPFLDVAHEHTIVFGIFIGLLLVFHTAKRKKENVQTCDHTCVFFFFYMPCGREKTIR